MCYYAGIDHFVYAFFFFFWPNQKGFLVKDRLMIGIIAL